MKQLRFFILSIFVFISITTNAVILSGYCGPNATFVLNDDGTLVISGTGEMDDFYNGAPWKDNAEDIIKVIIEDGITNIGYSAYSGCINLTSIPNSVTNIGNYAFRDCTSLSSITIPNSVTKIGDCAFNGCTSLTSITIPNSVTKIGYGAFRGCTSLTSITIPNSVAKIEGSAFADCTSLTSITIPNSVTSIDFFAFSHCTSLTSITIPNSVTCIGEDAFQVCTSLTSITIPNSVTEIGDGAFNGCTSLTSITIPNSVTSIGYAAFSVCTSLTSITIPNSVTEIGDYAFHHCYKISSVTLGNSVRHIGERAFRYCYNLKTFISRSYDVPETPDNTFESVKCKDGILYVPQKSLSKYASTSPWKEWGNIMGLPMVSSISLESYAKISVGESIELKPTIYPESADDKSVIWKSSNPDIASVDNGRVYAHKVGKATITATTVDGSNLSASCEIEVEPVLASSVSLSETVKTLKIGDNFTLTATVLPYETANKTVQWSSLNTYVASVDNGVVQAKNVGTATISVKTTDGSNISATCEVKVEPILATSISLSETSKTLNVGEYFTLSTKILPNNATSKDVSWNSSDVNVASVSNGVVTAIGPGSATITAKAADGSACSASCNVIVNKYEQSISWNQDLTAINIDGEMIELNATSSSGLPVTYKIADDNIASVFDMGYAIYLNPVNVGTTTLKVIQTGDKYYYPAEMTKTVIVRSVTGIENVDMHKTPCSVYSIDGTRIGVSDIEELKNHIFHNKLKRGLYIINRQKINIK